MITNCLYRVTFDDGSVVDNLDSNQVKEICADRKWRYIDTMQGVEIKKMMSKLNKGERLSVY